MNTGSLFNRRLIVLSFAAALILFAAWYLQQNPEGKSLSVLDALFSPASPKTTISQGALMAISLPDPAGRTHTLAEWQGRPMVINFWATWCLPCVKELPILAKFATDQKFSEVAVIGIAMDAPKEVQSFIAFHRLPYSILQESQGIADQLGARLGNPSGSLPFSAIVNRHGVVVETRLGPWREGELEAHMSPLLAGD
jgi:thiol-disulfide isomerase/thioredoxin